MCLRYLNNSSYKNNERRPFEPFKVFFLEKTYD